MNPLKLLLIAGLLAASTGALADWSLVPGQSQVNFVSVKSNAVAEVHHFKQLQGSVGKDGKAELMIDLASIDSGIPIRDERMQKFLFDIGSYPKATATVNFLPAALKDLAVAKPAIWDVEAQLDLHGMKVKQTWSLSVVKLDKKTLRVTTVKPVIISAGDFALTKGIAKLQELASLPSIATAVPVTVDLVFAVKP